MRVDVACLLLFLAVAGPLVAIRQTSLAASEAKALKEQQGSKVELTILEDKQLLDASVRVVEMLRQEEQGSDQSNSEMRRRFNEMFSQAIASIAKFYN